MSITIDGTVYNVPVISLKRKADVLDKSAERTEDGVLHREVIGVYFNYSISFGQVTDAAAYKALWEKLTSATAFHTIVVPDEDGVSYSFTAYITGVSDELRRVVGSTAYWKSLTANFIAQEPENTP